MKPFLINRSLDSSLEKEMNSFFIDKAESPYEYCGVTVPRVTHILSSMLHEDYLMDWANYIGRYKRQNHNDVREYSADIGTAVHEYIEKYISCNYIPDFLDIEDISKRIKVKNGFHSFKQWWDIILTHNIKVLMQEEPLVCKYYGGTLDMLISIDGLIYLVDFKTSNHFSYKYHLQTAAYRRILYYERGIIVDGIIILKLSKDQVYFEEQILNLQDYNTVQYVNQCETTFLSLVCAYYNRLNIEKHFKTL